MQQPQQMQQPQRPPGPLYTEEDVKQVREMFPDIEDEAIKSVLEANGGNKDATINCLLTMNSWNVLFCPPPYLFIKDGIKAQCEYCDIYIYK